MARNGRWGEAGGGGLVLAGCASGEPTAPVEQLNAPDGRIAYAVHCRSDFKSPMDCDAGARRQCGGDYDVLDQTEVLGVSGVGMSLEIACKASAS
jgi:hypothetical protein